MVNRPMTEHIRTQQKKCVLDVDFLGLGFEEKLCFTFGCTCRCLDMWFSQGTTKICSPKLVGKILELVLVILIIKHVSPYERSVKNWNMNKFWPLIKWDGNKICWIHYAKKVHHISTAKINAHKKMKNLQSYKTLHFLTLNFSTTLHTTLGFGYRRSLVWRLLVATGH
jgi:hypothetical protein